MLERLLLSKVIAVWIGGILSNVEVSPLWLFVDRDIKCFLVFLVAVNVEEFYNDSFAPSMLISSTVILTEMIGVSQLLFDQSTDDRVKPVLVLLVVGSPGLCGMSFGAGPIILLVAR